MLAPGFESVPGKHETTVALTRVMLPFLPLVSFAAVAMGMLNAHHRFGTPAFAPAVFNVVAIVWAAGLWWAGRAGPGGDGLGGGTLVGGAAQFLVQVPALVREGWRFAGVGAGRPGCARSRPDGAGDRGPGRRAGPLAAATHHLTKQLARETSGEGCLPGRAHPGGVAGRLAAAPT